MSLQRGFRFLCDRCGGESMVFYHSTAMQAKHQLYGNGWRFMKRGMFKNSKPDQHLCPGCTPTTNAQKEDQHG